MTAVKLQSPDAFTEILPRVRTQVSPDYGAFFSKVEYEMVRSGKRDADVFHLSYHNYDNEIEKIIDDGMVFKPIVRSRVYNGFSHKHIPVDHLGPGIMVYGVVARDLDTATRFKNAHVGKNTDHKSIGEMLGYPECCRTSFELNFKKSFDLVYESARATPGGIETDTHIELNTYNPLLRVDLRYAGIRVIPFFPCSYTCQEAASLSKIWVDTMYSIDPDMTDDIIRFLEKSPSRWSNLNGQVHVVHPDFEIMAGGYHDSSYREVRFL